MDDRYPLNARRAAGAILVLGFVALMVGAIMYNARNGSLSSSVYSPNYDVWERRFIIAAVILTVVGVSLLEGILGNVGDRVLARVGSTTYLFGAVRSAIARLNQ